MNAKEIAGKIRTSQEIARRASIHEMADVFESIAEQVELLVPRYRPPQPSDSGKYCYLEEFHKQRDCRPLYIALRDGRWKWYSELLVRWFEFDGGVWPCERPEGGA